MTDKLIEPKRAALKAPTRVTPATVQVFASARAPKAVVAEAPKFTPCRQCGNPGGCVRANRCVKGFK